DESQAFMKCREHDLIEEQRNQGSARLRRWTTPPQLKPDSKGVHGISRKVKQCRRLLTMEPYHREDEQAEAQQKNRSRLVNANPTARQPISCTCKIVTWVHYNTIPRR